MLDTTKPTNRLLAALPAKEYSQLLPVLERVALSLKEHIYDPGDVIHHIYFPESGIVSLLSAVEETSTLEVGIVGNEGIVGLPVFLGVKTSNILALVQGTGFALRMTATDFLEACRNSKELPQVLHRFIHSLMTQISQSAVCNRFHQIEPRLARWLLMMHDRIKTDKFIITQEFLSNMLGVRREAVSHSAGRFHKQGLISYSRGNLLILKRRELEAAACSCYGIIRQDYENFLSYKNLCKF